MSSPSSVSGAGPISGSGAGPASSQVPQPESPQMRALVRELSALPGGVWVTCAGRSMEPSIRLGDRVRVEACNRIHRGDVILLEGSRGYVLHRVILKVPGTKWFVHMGDAGSEDRPSMAHGSQVVGRAPLPRPANTMQVHWRAAWQGLGRVTGAIARRALIRYVTGI